MNRRDFLRVAGVGAATTIAGTWPRQARAFGITPSDASGFVLPSELTVDGVLELYLFGGVSAFESFYALDDGSGSGLHWFDDVETVAAECGAKGKPLQAFGPDSSKQVVHLGPFVGPLRERSDLLERLRISVMSHASPPHEVAIPLALTGRMIGKPNLAGLGAHVQRFALETTSTASTTPVSYVLLSASEIQTTLTSTALATGLHPGTVRPIGFRIDNASNFLDLLERPGVADRRTYDALLEANIDRYRQRLRWGKNGVPVRSRHTDDLASAARTVEGADALRAVLDPDLLKPIAGDACGATVSANTTAMNLKLAAHLLTHPTSPARYVCVIDGGLVPESSMAGGYDSHENNSPIQAQNLFSTLAALAGIINAPGEKDPTKIDLDRTLIIVNTEFGRTPDTEGNAGRGHWPDAYPVLYLGGPVRGKAAGVHGAIDPNAAAALASTPVAHRIAVLAALGIWPFEQESFNVSDVYGATSENEALRIVLSEQLGYVS